MEDFKIVIFIMAIVNKRKQAEEEMDINELKLNLHIPKEDLKT